MKTKYFIGMVAAALLVAGCKKESPASPPAPPKIPERTVSGEQVKNDIQQAAGTTKDYLVQSKDEAVAALQRQLADMDTKIDALKEKSQPYTDAAKTNADSALATLREDRDKAAQKLDELKAATADKWKDVKAGFDSSMDKLKSKYEELKDKFKS
jgi:hypothetical protein